MTDETFAGRPALNVTRTARSSNLAGPGDSATSTLGEELMTERARRHGSGSRTESGWRGPADTGRPDGGSGGMRAMVLSTGRETRLERRPVPTIGDDQLLVDVDLWHLRK
jgi:hypothetical protein